MRSLTLAEYRPSEPFALAEDELQALLAIKSLRIEPTERDREYVLTPGSEVGAIELESLPIVIEPKIPVDRVLFLASYALDPRRYRDQDISLPLRAGLVEALIPGFVAQARRAFARGVLQGYRIEEETSMVVRGRLLFEEQLRRRFGAAPPAEVRFDDFTEDIDANRLVKAAARRLGRLRIRSAASRRSLNLIETTLERVRHVEFEPRALPEIVFSRLNEHNRPVVELSKLILASTSYELGHGKTRGSAFLLDMNRVFENFVVVALRESLRLSPRAFPQGAVGHALHLAAGPRVRLHPDISWWSGRQCRFVGDAKYKRVSVEGYPNADLYQVLAYSIAADVSGGLLIYAAGESEPATYEVTQARKRLQVVTLDLAGGPDEILRQIDDVADRIRGMAELPRAA
jgi:5-methylcytosine-specific restriction enzyme subunit McrC